MEKQLTHLAQGKLDEVELIIMKNRLFAEEEQMVFFFGGYVYGDYIDEAVRMSDRLGNDYYYAHDHQYSPAALINDSGAVVEA